MPSSNSLLNNLQVNNLYCDNLTVNSKIDEDIKNIKNILKPGLYSGVINIVNPDLDNYTVNETLFIVHMTDYEDNSFIKFFCISDRTIKICVGSIKNNKILSTVKIIQQNNSYNTRLSEYVNITKNSFEKKYSSYKYAHKKFIENGDCHVNSIENGFEVLVFDENKNLIEKNIYTKVN